jgi:hypothetical protein
LTPPSSPLGISHLFACAGQSKGLKPSSHFDTNAMTTRQRHEQDMRLQEEGPRPTLAQKLGNVTRLLFIAARPKVLKLANERQGLL